MRVLPGRLLKACWGCAQGIMQHICFLCILRSRCLQVDETLLKATELRMAGNAVARSGDLKRACALYTVGLELDPPGGRHLLLSNRRCAAARFLGV